MVPQCMTERYSPLHMSRYWYNKTSLGVYIIGLMPILTRASATRHSACFTQVLEDWHSSLLLFVFCLAKLNEGLESKH
jgi:hypothetical protein